MTIKFSKYEGAGNDFVVVDNREGRFEPHRSLVAGLCGRRFGIGADGLMLLENDERTMFRMRYFNADGGESTMCGNGGRCMVLFADHLGVGGDEKIFSAPDGLHTAQILQRSVNRAVVALGMSDIRDIRRVLNGVFVDSGSPHYVEFVDNTDSVNVAARGRELRNDPTFAQTGGVNVNFVTIAAGGVLKVRTYERGVESETLACGTGVTASAVAADYLALSRSDRFDVAARGGTLHVSFKKEGDAYTDVVLTGKARRVFEGEFDSENFG